MLKCAELQTKIQSIKSSFWDWNNICKSLWNLGEVEVLDQILKKF